MKNFMTFFAAVSLVVSLCTGCTKSTPDDDDSNGDKTEQPSDPSGSGSGEIDWSSVDAKSTVRGLVSCNGEPLQGVVVTDGVNVTRTNKQGLYGLRTSSDKSKFVYLTIPSGYEVGTTHGFLPVFYKQIMAPTTTDRVQRYDFSVRKAADQTRHSIIVSADMHIRNRAMIKNATATTPSICPPANERDSTTFRRIYIKALNDYLKNLPAGIPVYGVNIGDMTNESHWINTSYNATLPNFIEVCERSGLRLQTFHAIGNHEHDMRVVDLVWDDDSAAEAAYNESFGPTYYSFDIGKVHYVVLDNTTYINAGGDRTYKEHLNSRQMEWIKKDCNYMAAGIQHIVLIWHCPAYRRNPMANKAHQMDNADDVLRIYGTKNLPITIWSGHSHMSETATANVDGVKATEYIHTSVSGAWWYFPLCVDGTPSTFTHYEFNGGEMVGRRSVNFNDENEQFYRLYNDSSIFVNGHRALRLNIWDWHTTWKVECRENGSVVSSNNFRQASSYDAYYRSVHDYCGNGIEEFDFLNIFNTDHIFEYVPMDPSANITLIFTDEFGREVFKVDTKLAD